MTDAVNHPAHYTSHPSGVECIQITEHMTFNAGNAVKYLWRAGLKNIGPMLGAPPGEIERVKARKHLEDLRKAQWYISREVKRIEKEMGQ